MSFVGSGFQQASGQHCKHTRSRLLGGWTAVPAAALADLACRSSLHNRHLIMLKHIRQHYERTDPQVGGLPEAELLRAWPWDCWHGRAAHYSLPQAHVWSLVPPN